MEHDDMKQSERIFAFEDRSILVTNLNQMVKARYGQSIFVNWPSDPEKDEVFSIGCSIMRLIDDASSDAKTFRSIPLRDIKAIPIMRENHKFYIEFPDREEVLQKVSVRHHALISSAEKALLRTTRQNLATIPLVRTGLNPILEIITAIVKHMDKDVALRTKDVGEQRRYLPFLEDLQFIKIVKEDIRPGPEVDKYVLTPGFKRSKSTKIIDAILGEVIENGFPYLKNEMKIQHLTPILRTANICYFNSFLKNDRVRLSGDDIISSYQKLYGNRAFKGRLKTLAYIQALSDAEIFEEVKRDVYSPMEDNWRAFKKETKAMV
jgi:hypothetical protein